MRKKCQLEQTLCEFKVAEVPRFLRYALHILYEKGERCQAVVYDISIPLFIDCSDLFVKCILVPSSSYPRNHVMHVSVFSSTSAQHQHLSP